VGNLVWEGGLALTLMAVAAGASARLRLSIVPFLIVAGLVVGPHLPPVGIFDLRFERSMPILAFLGRLGLLLLLFHLGLEFSVGRLLRAGRVIVMGGALYLVINLVLGLGYARLLGWPLREMLVAAGITTISSSAIVAKLLIDLRRTANPETEMILGIIMLEDIFLAVYVTAISGLVLSGATALSSIAGATALALGFMLGLLALGRLAVPGLNRALNIAADEGLLLVVMAGLLVVAGIAEALHVAEAIGALLVGLVLAETEHQARIEHLIRPLRDVFGAVFFFHFGLTIDPYALWGAVGPALGAVGLTLAGNVGAGLLAGRRARLSWRASTTIGLTILSRGEFSIIMANLGNAGGLLPVLQPFAALYVLILAVLGPLLTKEAGRFADAVSWVVTRQGRLGKDEPPPLEGPGAPQEDR
jgi:monovalent cation:H+ antiporter-2, CPA2 family